MKYEHQPAADDADCGAHDHLQGELSRHVQPGRPPTPLPAVRSPDIKAIPTGSLAPDSPSRMVPLRPDTSRLPSTEKTTAGSVGATAVPSSSDTHHDQPNTTWASTPVGDRR